MLLTNQPLFAVTNEAYKEKIAEFDPSFIIPEEKKLEFVINESSSSKKTAIQESQKEIEQIKEKEKDNAKEKVKEKEKSKKKNSTHILKYSH